MEHSETIEHKGLMADALLKRSPRVFDTCDLYSDDKTVKVKRLFYSHYSVKSPASVSVSAYEAALAITRWRNCVKNLKLYRNLSRLENAALAKNELAFVNALDATNIENRSAHQLARIVKLALKAGAFIAARAVAEKGLARFPDNPLFRQYVLSLSVPKVVSQNVPHNPALQANRNWLNEHSHEYSGQWVALRNGTLLGASNSFEELFGQIGRSKEILFTRA